MGSVMPLNDFEKHLTSKWGIILEGQALLQTWEAYQASNQDKDEFVLQTDLREIKEWKARSEQLLARGLTGGSTTINLPQGSGLLGQIISCKAISHPQTQDLYAIPKQGARLMYSVQFGQLTLSAIESSCKVQAGPLMPPGTKVYLDGQKEFQFQNSILFLTNSVRWKVIPNSFVESLKSSWVTSSAMAHSRIKPSASGAPKFQLSIQKSIPRNVDTAPNPESELLAQAEMAQTKATRADDIEDLPSSHDIIHGLKVLSLKPPQDTLPRAEVTRSETIASSRPSASRSQRAPPTGTISMADYLAARRTATLPAAASPTMSTTFPAAQSGIESDFKRTDKPGRPARHEQKDNKQFILPPAPPAMQAGPIMMPQQQKIPMFATMEAFPDVSDSRQVIDGSKVFTTPTVLDDAVPPPSGRPSRGRGRQIRGGGDQTRGRGGQTRGRGRQDTVPPRGRGGSRREGQG